MTRENKFQEIKKELFESLGCIEAVFKSEDPDGVSSELVEEIINEISKAMSAAHQLRYPFFFIPDVDFIASINRLKGEIQQWVEDIRPASLRESVSWRLSVTNVYSRHPY